MEGKVTCGYLSLVTMSFLPERIWTVCQEPKVFILRGVCCIADSCLGWLVVSWDGHAFSVTSQSCFLESVRWWTRWSMFLQRRSHHIDASPCFYCYFLRDSHVRQLVLDLNLWSRIILKPWCYCLHLLNTAESPCVIIPVKYFLYRLLQTAMLLFSALDFFFFLLNGPNPLNLESFQL